jgi:DegV family protein with EDD domain
MDIKEEFGKPVHVVDSKSLSGSLGLIVMQIARAIERDEKIDAIMKQAEQWVNNTGVFVSAKTLKYFIKGGRVSPLKGYISRLLNITPIISVTPEGKSFLFGKAFSQKSNMKKVIKHIEKLHKENEVLEYIVMHAQNDAAAGWFSEKMEDLTGISPLSIVNISPAIGINAGPGTVGVSIIQK